MNSTLSTRFFELWMMDILNHTVCKRYIKDIAILFEKNSKMENIINFLNLTIVI